MRQSWLPALKEPKEALPHLEKAISLNPDSEVAYYQLSLVYRALGDAVNQEKALAGFGRLRGPGSQVEKKTRAAMKPLDVTKQELEAEAVQ
jgi:tetratricopeptide (TPR) repeat protein